MIKKYIVRLSTEERQELETLVRRGKGPVYRIKHAQVLLAVDADGLNWTDERAAQAYHCHKRTVENVRSRFVEEGFEAAVERRKQVRPSRERILDGEKEARLISIACSKPQQGQARWTLKMLADELVVLEVVPSVSSQTVQRALKKTTSSRICGSAG